jgi:uncharacterized protein
MIPALTSLIALQQLDSAAEAARRRLTELPAAEQAIALRLAEADAVAEAAKARLADNHGKRRELEKAVAVVDSRLARFDEHKAAVKTNQEYTALLHEIATARSEKDRVEEQILLLMEEADAIAAEILAAETDRAAAAREGEEARRALADESTTLEAEIARLTGLRTERTGRLEAPVLARYEQLLKQRRMVAVAAMTGETCAACHVRLRPAVTQLVRRNSELVQCDSCQRILYYEPPPADAASAGA